MDSSTMRLGQSASVEPATGSTSLPATADPRAKALFKQALEACRRGAWTSAENSLRLAKTYHAGSEQLESLLREVVASREAERRASNHFRIS